MKILIDSYNTVFQNTSGGIQVRINRFIKSINKNTVSAKLFNKWDDKVNEFDIIHIFKANFESYELVKLARNFNIPVITSSIIPQEKKLNIIFNKFLNFILPIHTSYWYINQILNYSNVIITQTLKEKKFIERYYNIKKEKIKVIPNGINIDYNNQNLKLFREKTGIKGKFLLQVGRFDKNKNQLNVIKALKNSNIEVVFIGGPDQNDLGYYNYCKKLAGKNFHFLGWISHDNPLLASAYLNAEVVILPSIKEIFGNSLIEGGAAGAKLIATKELPLAEWGLNKLCFTVDPLKPKDILKNVKLAFNTKNNSEVKNRINYLFSWKNVAKQYILNYERILKDNGKFDKKNKKIY